MKTTALLIAAAASLTLAACSEDEPLSVNTRSGDAISFRPAMGSRATEVTNANLQSFYVYSFLGDAPYFNNVAYTKGADGFYNSATPYYWPVDNTPLDFYAFSPSIAELMAGSDEYDDELSTEEGEAGMTMNATAKKLENFRVNDSIGAQVDFITANGTGTRNANMAAGLELTFGHRLSQIEIQAKSENKDYTFKVMGARIGRAENKGTFDFTTNTWTLDDWHETSVYTASCPEVTLSATPVSIMGAQGNAMLLPQTLTAWDPTGDPDNVAREAYLAVLVQITTTDTGTRFFPTDSTSVNGTKVARTYGWAAIPLKATWEAGKKYIYTLDFTNGAGFTDPDDPNPGKPILDTPIKFTVNVENWIDTNSPVNMPVK